MDAPQGREETTEKEEEGLRTSNGEAGGLQSTPVTVCGCSGGLEPRESQKPVCPQGLTAARQSGKSCHQSGSS